MKNDEEKAEMQIKTKFKRSNKLEETEKKAQ